MSKWDRKYTDAPEGLFGTSPNAYVCEVFARCEFDAKTGLCLADGDGRNSRWLASRGLQMTAVDLSQVACANGEALDVQAGVLVKRIAADIESWQVPDGVKWDSVFIMYLQAPAAVRRAAFCKGWEALLPGGIIVAEAFSKSQAEPALDEGSVAGPGAPDLMYDLAEIRTWLPNALFIEALEGNVLLDEGARHHGMAHVVRIAALKV